MIEVLGQNLELGEKLKLQFLRERRNFGGAQLVEDDLEHQELNINSPHTRANPGRNFPRDRAGFLGQFHAGNLLISVSSH